MNSIACKVVDATGREFLHTFASADYAEAFKRHARWWIRHRTRSGARRDTTPDGRRLEQPVRPCKLVIEPYDDPTAR